MSEEPAESSGAKLLRIFTFDLSITIEGPVMTAGIGYPVFGIDDTNLLGGDRNKPVLPESLVRGNVVHVLREMAEAMASAGEKNEALEAIKRVQCWLGSSSDTSRADDRTEADTANDTNIPYRRKILFSDFELQGSPKGRRITRIALDDWTGSVKHGSLQVLESPLDYGEPGVFQGTVTLLLPEDQAKVAREWIVRALACVPAYGAHKGSGFGRNAGVTATDVQSRSPAESINLPEIAKDTQRLGFALTLDRPFLVNAQSISANQFKGAIDIPGAAIKGALADMLIASGLMTATLADALDKLVFRHAKPAKSAGILHRPRAIPLSLYKANGALMDALADCPVAAGSSGAYVEFQGDWKDDGDARGLYGHTFEPIYDIRTRTKVSETGTAEDEKLFTQLAVVRGDHVWVGEIVRPEGVAPADFKAIVGAMAAGITGLGKTRANATVEWLAPLGQRTVEPVRTAEGKTTWRLTLETDAILHGPGDEHEPLEKHYRAYFAAALGHEDQDTISLRFYARQRWVGGYQARRFPLYPDRYAPQLITEAGSVFELTTPAGLDDKFTTLAHFGLPLPKTIGKDKKHQFERSAFNPENGYGEVTIEERPLTERAVPMAEDH